MTHSELRSLALAVLAALIAIFLSACETTTTVAHRTLPAYEPPIGRNDFQSVRTTAYTHTEADHTQYSNHNALGGELSAASAPIRRAENTVRGIPVVADQPPSGAKLQPFTMAETRVVTRATTKETKTIRGKKVVVTKSRPPKIGSAAADWSRWPAGTTFRLLSTGQMYRVDDYGWALSGRNTIDLYMSTRSEMNTWGTRQEPIQILQWGDRQESLRLLQAHRNHPHIKRMVLELEGHDEEAAALH